MSLPSTAVKSEGTEPSNIFHSFILLKDYVALVPRLASLRRKVGFLNVWRRWRILSREGKEWVEPEKWWQMRISEVLGRRIDYLVL